MRVFVAFRGGVGDFFVWLTKIVPLLEWHKDDDVDLGICSTWPEGIRSWSRALPGPGFRRTVSFEYDRPIGTADLERCMIGSDLIYHLDVWKGSREQRDRPELVPLCAASDVYEWLEPEWYPELKIDGDGVGGTVFQPAGRSVGDICTPEWWRLGLEARQYPRPLRIVGNEVDDPAEYGASEKITDPISIYSAIKDADLMIGIDSGLRNIAFTVRTPVIEIRKSGRGLPDYSVFVPEVYRETVTFLDLDPPTLATIRPRGIR